jgi:outer membrane protein assembly factor BamB
LATWTNADGAHLLYTRGNSFSEYAGWPLGLVHRVPLDNFVGISDALVADVDSDGVFELIVTSNNWNQAVQAYSLTNGALLWEVANLTSYNAKLHVAQMDADPALEIFLTGIPGTIIDGATHAIEWQYKDGFGPLLEHGRFGGSSPRFASLGSRLTMFQSQPWSPIWDFDDLNARTSAVADVDGDQLDELIEASDNFPYSISVFDVQSQTLRSSFPESSALQIAAGDFDGDPSKEIAIGRNAVYNEVAPNSFRVINATTGADEFVIPTFAPGPYVAGGFVSASGSIDLIFGSGSSANSGGNFAGTITRVNSSNGAIIWRTAANDPTLDLIRIRNLQVASIAGQPEPVVFAAGTDSIYGQAQIVALRSGDGSVLWRINSGNSALPDNVSINGMSTVDLDGDTLADSILICTSEPRLRLFNAADQSQTWSSVAMSADCRNAMQMPSDGSTQLVAVLSGGLRAYDAQTHLLSWSLPFANGMRGATYIARGVTGPELAVFSDNDVIAFYDAETRAFLRYLQNPEFDPIQAIAQPAGASIHDLVAGMNNRLYSIDGVSGAISASSAVIGNNVGQFNQLAIYNDVDGSALIGAGSEVGVSTYRLSGLSDAIFRSGFESTSP